MKVILTHIRNPIPDYVYKSLDHFRSTNTDIDVDFLTDIKYLNESDHNFFSDKKINLVDYHQYDGDSMLKKFNDISWTNKKATSAPNTKYPSQSFFWHCGIEKWYYILSHMKKENMKHIISFENDNLIFKNILDYESFFTKFQKLSFPKNNDIQYISSFGFIPSIETLEVMCSKIISYISEGEKSLIDKYKLDMIHEMTLLHILYLDGHVNTLPSLPGESEEAILFDALAYGMYLCGTNLRHPAGHVWIDGYNNKIGTFIKNGGVPIFDIVNKCPHVIWESKKYDIFNAHIHSKDIQLLT
jgi:hypothetical protein